MSKTPSSLKCCFFIPVDIGLIMWGVVKLGFNIVIGFDLLWVAAFYANDYKTSDKFDWVIMIGYSVYVLIRAFNIAMAILLIIGAALKNVKLLHIFTIGETFAIAANLIALFTGIFMDVWTKEGNWKNNWFSTTLSALHLCLQIYVVKLVLQKKKEVKAEVSDIGE